MDTLSSLFSRFVQSKKPTKGNGKGENLGQVLDQCQSQIKEATASLETLFVAIGTDFAALYERCDSLVKACELLREIGTGKKGGLTLMQEIVVVLREPLHFIDDTLQRQASFIEVLKVCEAKTSALLAVKQEMTDTLAPLAYTSVLFKIEAATLAAEVQATFSTVTTEVDALRHRVEQSFRENAVLLQRMLLALARVRQKLEADFRNHAASVAEKRSKIDTALATLDRQLFDNQERDTRLHAVTKALQEQVGEVVLGLQFQDIIQQKCDHVIASLTQAAETKEEAGKVALLNSCHLEAVEQDLKTGLTAVETGLHSIQGLVTRMEQQSLTQNDLGALTSSTKGLVQLLLDTLGDTRHLVELWSELAEHSFTQIQPAQDVARQFSTTLVDLASSMRVIAINAQVRSVTGGRGNGLGTLSAQTADISQKLTVLSQRTQHHMQELQKGIGNLLDTFGTLREKGRVFRGKLQQEGGTIEQSLHAHRDETLRLIHNLGDGVDGVHQSISELSRDLASVPEIRTKISLAAETLRQAHKNWGSHTGTQGNAALKAHTARYTMASERKVHAQIAGSAQITPPKKPSESSGTPELF